jgi:hypothetical protein
MVQDNHPQAAKYASQQVLPQWLDAFRVILASDPASSGNWTSLHIRNEIFQVSHRLLSPTIMMSVDGLSLSFLRP